MKRKRKSSLQRRVLAASVILSLLIVVGGTFAWFTSYDEVVNKLTAVHNYGVSITEDFTAPENWLPGQAVNKDVQAVNTGNVDALVRMALTSRMEVRGTKEETFDTGLKSASTLVGYPAGSTGMELGSEAQLQLSEVLRGKQLVTLGAEEIDEIKNKYASAIRYPMNSCNPDSVNSIIPFAERISDIPPASSCFLFFEDANGALADGQDVRGNGYWYLTASDANLLFGSELYHEDIWVAADMNESGNITFPYLGGADSVDKVIDGALNYDFTNINDADAPRIMASNANGIRVNIYLAPNWSTSWAWSEAEKAFYYKDSLKAGVTSEKLIDSVELDGSVPGDAYEEFNYYLTVTLDSVQITVDANGNETADAVPDAWGMQPAVTLTDGKMSAVAWTAAP